MDPTANLAEQRVITAIILTGDLDIQELHDKADRLAELAEAIDSWITRGGHLPQQWTKDRGK